MISMAYPPNLHLLRAFKGNHHIFGNRSKRNTEIPRLPVPKGFTRVPYRAFEKPLDWCHIGGRRSRPQDTGLGGPCRGPGEAGRVAPFRVSQRLQVIDFYNDFKQCPLGAHPRGCLCRAEEPCSGPIVAPVDRHTQGPLGTTVCGLATFKMLFTHDRRPIYVEAVPGLSGYFRRLFCSSGSPHSDGGLSGGPEGREQGGGLQGITTDLFWIDRMQPTRCSGCGAPLQTQEESAVGFVPKHKYEEYSGGRVKRLPRPRGQVVESVPDGVEVLQQTSPKFRVRTSLLTCQRCYRMQHYRSIDSSWERSAVAAAGCLPALSPSSVITQLTRIMPNNSIVLKIVDIFDLELSVVPELFAACREKGLKAIWVVNRVDCLPKHTDMNQVKQWVRRMVRQIRNVHIDDCVLVSSATGYGFDNLERRIGELLSEDSYSASDSKSEAATNPRGSNQLQDIEGRFMFVVGRVNAGKSTFVNRFLKFVGYKHFGTLFMKRAVGGATRSPLPGTTLDLIPFGLPKGFKLIDTPGIPSQHQMASVLLHGGDLLSVVPTKRIQPLTFALTEGKTILIGALARVDLVHGNTALCTCYFSHKVTLHICRTSKAEDLLKRKAGVFLYPPHMPEDFNRLQPLVRHRVEVYGGRYTAHDDISIGGLGWFSVAGSGVKAFDIWLPRGVKLFRRPSLFPAQIRKSPPQAFHSKTPRARGPRISAQKRALAAQIKEEEMRRHQEEYQQIQEADGADRGTEPTTAANAEAAPLVAPENQEKFQLLVSQWLEGDIDHEQQPQQQQQEEEQQQQHQQQEEQLQQQQQQQEEQQQQQQQQQGQQQG